MSCQEGDSWLDACHIIQHSMNSYIMFNSMTKWDGSWEFLSLMHIDFKYCYSGWEILNILDNHCYKQYLLLPCLWEDVGSIWINNNI